MLLYLFSSICWLLRARLLHEPDEPLRLGCSGHGELDACGQCICERNYFGNACECYYSETLQWGPRNTSEAIAKCTPNDAPDALVCSGQGKCRCGYCECFPKKSHLYQGYSGQFCECDDYSCPYHNNAMCGGHGHCHCGKCDCYRDFVGEACECSTSVDTCRSRNGQICNGKGVCVCGVCECEAESPYKGPTCEDCPPIVEMSSDTCNNHGSLDSCGQCVCDRRYSGNNCECEGSLITQCMRPNTTRPIPCSGRGECVCGTCACFPRGLNPLERYSGRFCQCDDYSCNYHNYQLCGGHGECICGFCMCDEGYSGVACECPISQETCMADNGLICNGMGSCTCGVCVCDAMSSYRGPTCEDCPMCPGICQKYKECVRCKVFGTGVYSKEECFQKCPYMEMVDRIDVDKVTDDERMYLCQFIDDDDDLRFTFSYTYFTHTNIHLTAQTTKEVP